MLKDVLITVLPTFLALLFIFALIKLFINLEFGLVFRALVIGIIAVVPAIFSMKLITVLIAIVIPGTLPGLFYLGLSGLNEELFKLFALKIFGKNKSALYSIFIGGGFALCETLYVAFGVRELAVIRTLTTLPLHIVTSFILFQCIAKERKRFFILSLTIHLLFNLVIR